MISVFSSFVLGDDPTIKMFGVGLAVAVLLDATVVRMVIVPAVMSLAGKAAWWLPAGSTRLYPTSTSKAKHSSPASKPTPQSAPPPQPTASSSVQAGNNTRPSKGSAAWTGDT
jgi:RND superfamily putative drug exporter